MPASESKASEPKKLPGIFISYRRSDAPDAVGRIYDRLVTEFGKARVFKDVDSIPLGQDFRGHLNDIVGGCAAVLAIVGPKWTDIRNEAGQKRLDDPDDFVRIELEAALARSVPVVPVLVGHAPMPGTLQLPSTLSSLAFRQSIEVRPDPDFHNDATRLVAALRQIIDPNAPQVQQPSGNPKRTWVPWLVGFAAAMTLAAIAFAVPALKYLRLTPPSETRTEISAPALSDVDGSIALSPDGRQIVYVGFGDGTPRLRLRALAATVAQSLPGTEGAHDPFWSPDGRSIGFFTSNALKRLDVGGGVPLSLAPVAMGYGGTWNTEGVILFSPGFGQSIARIAATGGAVTPVTHFEQGALVQVSPEFLPDGRRFVYSSMDGKAPGTYLGSLDGATHVRLTPAFGDIAYLPSGWVLVWDQSKRVLVAQRLDASKSALAGDPVILAEGANHGAVSVSATGLVAYRSGALAEGAQQLQWRSRTGAELGSIGESKEAYDSPRVSPDGRRVAVVHGESGHGDIWVLEGERASRVTLDAAGYGYPLWSRDGSQIVFAADRNDVHGLYQKSADGTGEDQLLLNFSDVIVPSSFSPDGRYLSYVSRSRGTGLDVGFMSMTGDRKPRSFLNSVSFEGAAEFSPDGKWVAYQSDETSRRQVYIRSFAAGEAGATPAHSGKWQVSTSGGAYPKWSPDGKELFFLNPAGDMMAAPLVFAGSALTSGTPVKLFQTRVVGGGQGDLGPQYDVARDGRFLINTVLETAAPESSPIILIQNWNPDAGK